jgi:predicted RNA-binding protein
MEDAKEVVEKDNILFILNNTLKALQKKDVFTLKDLSNRTIHSASIYQDTNSITLAVVVYALSKIAERPKYEEYKDWPKFYNIIEKNIQNAVKDLKYDDIESFQSDLMEIRDAISKLSGHLKIYIEEVFRKAAINKASRIYEHGVSMQQTAEMLGVSPFELAEYAGGTGISDVNLSLTLDIRKRINLARSIFKK